MNPRPVPQGMVRLVEEDALQAVNRHPVQDPA